MTDFSKLTSDVHEKPLRQQSGQRSMFSQDTLLSHSPFTSPGAIPAPLLVTPYRLAPLPLRVREVKRLL